MTESFLFKIQCLYKDSIFLIEDLSVFRDIKDIHKDKKNIEKQIKSIVNIINKKKTAEYRRFLKNIKDIERFIDRFYKFYDKMLEFKTQYYYLNNEIDKIDELRNDLNTLKFKQK